MRILWLHTSLPYPPDSGGKQDTFFMMREFSRLGHKITSGIIFHGDTPPEIPGGFSELITTSFFLPGNQGKLHKRLFASLSDDVPFKFRKYYSKAAVSKLVEFLKIHSGFDCIIVDHLHLAPLILDSKSVVSKNGIKIPPIILRTPNVESTIVKKYSERVDNPLVKAFAGNEAEKMKEYESRILSEFALVASISPVDADKFTKMTGGNVNIVTVTGGADIDNLQPPDTDPIDGEVVYVGAFDWQPNVDAAVWLINEVWPLVLKNYPGAHCTLVGKNPPPYLEKLASDSVTLTGFVPSVIDFINPAACGVVPLWVGSGMRFKILEAFALGKAVVSTTLGAEGIEITDGSDILIRDDPESFAEGIAAVLRDENLRRKLGKNARILVENKYAWNKVAEGFIDEILKLL
jgi:polysaccharide biosynthesis protein PslH